MIEVIDNRSAAADPDATEEALRQQTRRTIRAQLAEKSNLLLRASAYDDQLAEIDRELTAAADEHSAACGPLQAELKRLEDEAVERVMARKGPDRKADQRRIEIIKLINRHNAELEKRTAELNAVRRTIGAERTRLRHEAALLGNASRLTKPGVGCPKLRAQLFVAERRIAAAKGREEAARQGLARLRDPEFGGDTGRRRREWEAEAAAASAELAAAMAAAREIERALIEE